MLRVVNAAILMLKYPAKYFQIAAILRKLNELPRCPTLPVLYLYPDLTRTPDLDKHPSS